MIRRLPLAPTLIVLVAVAVMVRLGFWQLSRMHDKEDALARYQTALTNPAEAAWDGDPAAGSALLFRKVRMTCRETIAAEPMAGHNTKGETGWAQQQLCVTPQGHSVLVVTGWASQPDAQRGDGPVARWPGGTLHGYAAAGKDDTVRVIASPPLGGLAANARPDPSSVPNNHLSYAVQWFLFALTALVIYALALRKRWRG